MLSRAFAVSTLSVAIGGLLVCIQHYSHAEQPADAAKPAANNNNNNNNNQPDPLPLAEKTRKALAYLADQQADDGGWGQGGGWRQNLNGGGRVEGAQVKDPSDLGNTCFATLALLRAGNVPSAGIYATQVARGIAYICTKVEQSDSDSLYVTDVRDTQLQSKIGHYVDTFLAGLALSEWKAKMPAASPDRRALAALDKVLRKIEKNQNNDGTFTGNTGWASVLSQGLACKCLNRASQLGCPVRAEALERDFANSIGTIADGKSAVASSATAAAKSLPALASSTADASRKPAGAAAPSDAGVRLYSAATNASRISDFGNTNALQEKGAAATLDRRDATPAEQAEAKQILGRAAGVRKVQQEAVDSVVAQLKDKSFIAGFGNNGGEEFLSYMNIGEMLAASRGPKWDEWRRSITENLDRVQNQDGSWSGQHCITGRTFCTSAALLTLMADRAPLPQPAKLADAK